MSDPIPMPAESKAHPDKVGDSHPSQDYLMDIVNKEEDMEDDYDTLKLKKVFGLFEVMKKYFASGDAKVASPCARVNSLKVLEKSIFDHSLYRDEGFIENVVIQYLNTIYIDPCPEVRKLSIQIVIRIIMETSRNSDKSLTGLLGLVKSFTNRPFLRSSLMSSSTPNSGDSVVNVLSEDDMSDVLISVNGLIDIFKAFMMSATATTIAVKSFKLLVDHLNNYYKDGPNSCLQGADHKVKETILSFFLSIRCNHLAQIGLTFKDSSQPTLWSPFLSCAHLPSKDGVPRGSYHSSSSSSPPPTPSASPRATGRHPQIPVTVLPLTEMFMVILTCLEKEKDWIFLKTILTDLKKLVASCPTMIRYTTRVNVEESRQEMTIANDIVSTAYKLITSKDRHKEIISETPIHKFDLEKMVHPLLESLIVYGRFLGPHQQTELVKAIKSGILNPTFKSQAIFSLTRCLMEMQDQKFIKLLPEIMVDFSKISVTKSLAVPKLTFLLTLTLFPNLYGDFTDAHYKNVFATAIPYTNYGEFSEFVVSLAHRVITLWFLNCKMSSRKKEFVSYIRSHLALNMEQLVKDQEMVRNRSQSVGPTTRRKTDLLPRLPTTPTIPSSSSGGSHFRFQLSPSLFPGPMSAHALTTTNTTSTNSAASSVFHFSDTIPTTMTSHATNNASAAATNASGQQVVSRSLEFQKIVHQELFETSMDVLARYTHSMTAPVPARPTLADFFIDPKTAMTWIGPGMNLTTICTSYCTQRVDGDGGFCLKCMDKCLPYANERTTSGSGSSLSSSVSSTLEDSDTDRNGLTSSTDSTTRVFSNNSSSTPATTSNTPAPPPLTPSVMDQSRRRHQTEYLPRKAAFSINRQDFKPFRDDHHLTTMSSVPLDGPPTRQSTCGCWCQGWAQVVIRRPTGKTSFVVRIENSLNPSCFCPSGCDSSITPLLNLYSGRKVSSCDNGGHTSKSVNFSRSVSNGKASTGQRLSANDEQATKKNGVALNDCRADSGVSSSGSFRRTSSSPEIERQLSNQILNCSLEDDIEEAREVREDGSNLSSSPSKVSRAVSLGKGDITQSGGANLGRAASFSQRKSSPKAPQTTSEDVVDGISFSSITRKKSLHIDLSHQVTSNGHGQSSTTGQSSPTKSHPSKKVDNMSSLESIETKVPPEGGMRARSQTVSSAPVRGSSSHPLRQPSASTSLLQTGFHPLESHARPAGLRAEFVFLQLFYNNYFLQPGKVDATHTIPGQPILLPKSFETSVKNLDWITPFETHKIGVIFVDWGQELDRSGILSNKHGSSRFQNMLDRMATLIRLSDVSDDEPYFLGGLCKDGTDGKFVYTWQDHLSQVVFHVATLMPNKDYPSNCDEKWRHIGNDLVCIAYNDSKGRFDMSTLGNGLIKVCIVITPVDCGVNMVEVQTKDDEFSVEMASGYHEPFMISDTNLPLFVRQLAVHFNFALQQEYNNRSRRDPKAPQLPYLFKWVERLRALKKIHDKLTREPVGKNVQGDGVTGLRPRPDGLDFSLDFTNFS